MPEFSVKQEELTHYKHTVLLLKRILSEVFLKDVSSSARDLVYNNFPHTEPVRSSP